MLPSERAKIIQYSMGQHILCDFTTILHLLANMGKIHLSSPSVTFLVVSTEFAEHIKHSRGKILKIGDTTIWERDDDSDWLFDPFVVSFCCENNDIFKPDFEIN